jgi:hypothetical protein
VVGEALNQMTISGRRRQGKKHVPTEQSINEVRAYATVGTPHHDIAMLIDVSTETLLKYYRPQLDQGKARGVAMVAKTLYTMATVDNNLGAAIFFLKCQGGWRETSVVQSQLLDADGKPVDQPKLGISFSDGGPGLPLKALTHGNRDNVEEPSAADSDAEPSVTH